MSDKLMTTAEAAKALGVNDSRIRQMIRRNRLPAQKVGRDWIIERREVEKVLRDRQKPRKRMGRPYKQPPGGADA